MTTLVLFLLMTSPELARLVSDITASGIAITASSSPSGRVSPLRQIAPGGPPLLTFRYYEGQKTRHFSNTDLVLDDAGH